MKKILIMFFLFSILGIEKGFSIEVGDEVIFNWKTFENGKITKIQYKSSVIEHDPSLNLYLKRTEFLGIDGQSTSVFEEWISVVDFISQKEINIILKNCESWGGKKDFIKLIDKATQETKSHEVCISSEHFGRLSPLGEADFYYYGHFPIYGFVKADKINPRMVLYDENIVF